MEDRLETRLVFEVFTDFMIYNGHYKSGFRKDLSDEFKKFLKFDVLIGNITEEQGGNIKGEMFITRQDGVTYPADFTYQTKLETV